MCAAHGVALPVAAIHFCLGQPAVSAIVLGAVKPVEVTANIEAVSASVPAGLWSDLKGEGLLPDGVPVPA